MTTFFLESTGRRLCLAAAILAMATTVPAMAGDVTYIVRGGAMGAFHEHLDVYDSEFTAIENAIVTVNETVIPHVSGSRYSGVLPEALGVGDPVSLMVEIGAVTITGDDVIPASAIITTPADGENVSPGGTVLVEWTSDTDPDRFHVSPFPCDGVCGWDVDDVSRSFEMPIDGFPLNEPVQIRIYAYNHGTFTGPVEPTSNMNLRYWAGPGALYHGGRRHACCDVHVGSREGSLAIVVVSGSLDTTARSTLL